MGRVWDTELPGNLKLLLLAYADAAEHDGTEIWPGRKRVALMCGISVATADRLTKKLLEGGYLIQVQKGHRGQRAAYRIPLDMVGNAYQVDTHSETESLSTRTESLSTDAAKPITPDTPPVLDPSSTPVLQDAPRKRNLYWDAVVIIFGEPSKGQLPLYGRFVKMVEDGGYNPSDIPDRVARLTMLWGPDRCTVASLEKYWTRFDGQISGITDADVDAFIKAQDREAAIARLSE